MTLGVERSRHLAREKFIDCPPSSTPESLICFEGLVFVVSTNHLHEPALQSPHLKSGTVTASTIMKVNEIIHGKVHLMQHLTHSILVSCGSHYLILVLLGMRPRLVPFRPFSFVWKVWIHLNTFLSSWFSEEGL